MPTTSTATVNSRKLEHGLRMIRAGIPFGVLFGVLGEGCSQLFGVYCMLDGDGRRSTMHRWHWSNDVKVALDMNPKP